MKSTFVLLAAISLVNASSSTKLRGAAPCPNSNSGSSDNSSDYSGSESNWDSGSGSDWDDCGSGSTSTSDSGSNDYPSNWDSNSGSDTTEEPATYAPAPTSAPTSAPTETPATSKGTLKEQIIHQTNLIRAAHGLGPVKWNDELAAKMQAWANSDPQQNGGGHGGPPGNQNLASFDVCNDNCMRMTGPAWAWYSGEEKLWDYDANKSRDGIWETTGHFSNSMDPGVNEIACGYSTFYNPQIGHDDSLVWCNYLGGNNGVIPRPRIDQATLEKQLTSAY
uniref:Secreted protein n=1 Tax=Thraustotheca clavata TaxID=74557 RepID=A0A0A7CLS7_9STRA|nr:secreted protein [Thraustotheca clavata]